MVEGVNSLRLAHCSLTLNIEDSPLDTAAGSSGQNNPWGSPEAQELVSAIAQWKATRGGNRRYPRLLGELELSNECLTFISRTPNAFIVAKEKVKHDAQQSKTRKTSEPEAQ